jgi:hypothetical protein
LESGYTSLTDFEAADSNSEENIYFNELPKMSFFLYHQNRIQMKTIIDLRVDEMVTHRRYFNEIVDFAKECQTVV